MNEGIFAPILGLRSPGMPSELGERSRARGAGRARGSRIVPWPILFPEDRTGPKGFGWNCLATVNENVRKGGFSPARSGLPTYGLLADCWSGS
jgi:hypothetical protein